MKTLLAVFLLLQSSLFALVSGQEVKKYWITLSNKNTSFNPSDYFSIRTIEQRLQNSIILDDSSDFPVNEKYLSAIKEHVAEMGFASRWLNGVAVFATENQIEELRTLSFIKEIQQMNSQAKLSSWERGEATEESIEYTSTHFTDLTEKKQKLLRFQLDRMRAGNFQANKINGSGIRIAVFDAGFPNVDKHPAFAHLFNQHRIIATYDFVSKKENVYNHNSHGTGTLSCIAGICDSINIGMATGAEFLLARTEIASREPFSEEENWLAAAEWADRNGANIISCSLGYTDRRYFNTQMDGKTSLVSRAANMAASKGILVICAAGNEGIGEWRFIDTPADADSVLAVGGTNPYTDYKINFSSYGPTSDGRLKPNVCAVADVVLANGNGYAEEFGTSFSTPLVAGFAACVWQMYRDWSNMKLFQEIEKSSHLYPYFDYAHGYGIPQADYFTLPLALGSANDSVSSEPTFDFVILNDNLTVSVREKYAYPEQEKLLGYDAVRNLYYRVDGIDSKAKFYAVVLAEQQEVLSFRTEQFSPGDKLVVHFEGFTNSYTITGNEKPPSPYEEK